MKRQLNQSVKQISKSFLILTLLFVSLLTACSGSDKKNDESLAVQKKAPSRAEKLGLTDKALASFERAAAELAKEKPDTEKALDDLQTAVTESPEFAEAQYNLGLIYLQQEEPDKAIKALEKARNVDPSQPEYGVALGRAYAGIERFDDAHKLFEEIVAREPDNLNAKNNLAVLELRRGNTDKAIQILQEILREDEKNVAALNTMGRVYHKAGNLSLAKYVFEEKALKADPKNADIHNNLGLVFLDMKQVPDAVLQFQEATDDDPNHFEAHLNLGTIVFEYLDYKRADNEFSEAVRVVPANCTARLGLASTRFATSQYDSAVENYNYYLDKCDGENIAVHEHLAKIYQSGLNDPAKALDEYRTLVKIAKDEKSRKNYEAMVQFLEGEAKKAAQKPADEKKKE